MVLFALCVAVISVPFLVDANRFRPMLEGEFGKALGRKVTVGRIKIALLEGGLTAYDLAVADDAAYGARPFLHAKSLTLRVELKPLVFERKVYVTLAVLEQPQIDLIQSSAGDWNFSHLGGGAAAGAPPPREKVALTIKLIEIHGGRLTLAQPGGGQPKVLENVDVEMRDFSVRSAFGFRLTGRMAGGGDLQLDGNAGPVDRADVAQTPAKVRVKLAGFDLATAGAGGLLALEGVAASNGTTLYLNGRIEGRRLKLARNGSPARERVAFEFALEHDLRKRAGVLRRGDIRVGRAPASLTGSYAPEGEAMRWDMNLAGRAMPVPDLEAMLPVIGLTLPAGTSLEGGTANARLSLAGPAAALIISGTVGLDNTRLKGFDLSTKMSTIQKLAGIHTGPDTDIQTFSAKLRVAPEGTKVEDIKLVAPTLGELSGGGTISPAHALNFKMHAVLHTSGALMAALGQTGGTGVPFTIGGTAEQPVFDADLAGMAAENAHKIDLGKAAKGLMDSLFGSKPRQ